MNAGCFSITGAMWNQAIDSWKNNVYKIEKEDSTIQVIVKKAVNYCTKPFVLIALILAVIATPFFAMVDLFYSGVKALFCKDIKPVEATSVLDFYRGKATHDTKLTLEQILAKDDVWLEEKHDFIQWLFPTEEKGVNRNASLSDQATQDAFKKDPELQNNMRQAFVRMLKFYGYVYSMGNIEKVSNYDERINNLLKNTHNNLRITRILTSLRLHGLQREAQQFKNTLKELVKEKTPGTIQ